MDQTDALGRFFPINAAQKGMSIEASSVITAVNIAYGASQDELFVDAAKLQQQVLLDQNGFDLARRIEAAPHRSREVRSIQLRDGKNGDEGALGIVRAQQGEEEIAVVFKYTSQGLGHGHFDKLSHSIYNDGTEVLQDYGAARWVNIDQKAGGRKTSDIL